MYGPQPKGRRYKRTRVGYVAFLLVATVAFVLTAAFFIATTLVQVALGIPF